MEGKGVKVEHQSIPLSISNPYSQKPTSIIRLHQPQIALVTHI